ncbi:MAG: DUF1295 domain-containing protein, partial [Pseudomonadota bacterium]
LTGSITYIAVVVSAVSLSGELDLRGKLAATMVIIWCSRLGLFLFTRISKDGEDRRFREIKINPLRFLGAWTLQALWVILTAACAIAIITTREQKEVDVFLIVGALMWVTGFGIEVVADAQKRAFRKDPANQGKFIQSGLWAWSQHPNYFGEIALWTGVLIMAIPILHGGAWLCVISPLFVFLLLTRVSGIPMLDEHAKQKWGDDPDYLSYVERTSKLLVRPPRR